MSTILIVCAGKSNKFKGKIYMFILQSRGFFFQTFFYAAIDDSEYSFAYILTDTDKVNNIIEFVGN